MLPWVLHWVADSLERRRGSRQQPRPQEREVPLQDQLRFQRDSIPAALATFSVTRLVT